MILKLIFTFIFLLSCELVTSTRHLELLSRFEAISKKSKSVRPRSNGATTKVNVSADLLSMDLDPLTAKAQLNIMLKIHWEDGRLAWDNKAYRTDTMWVDPEKLWTPDVAIINRIDGQPFLALNSPGMSDLAKVLRDGSVELQTRVNYGIKCKDYLARPKIAEDGTEFQGRSIWDDFECELLRIGSWVYGREDVDFVLGDMNLDSFDNGSNVKILGDESVRSIKKSSKSALSFTANCRNEYFISKRDHNIYWNSKIPL